MKQKKIKMDNSKKLSFSTDGPICPKTKQKYKFHLIFYSTWENYITLVFSREIKGLFYESKMRLQKGSTPIVRVIRVKI